MHDACGCDKCSDKLIGGHFTAGGPTPAGAAPRDEAREALAELVAAMRTHNVSRVDDAIKAADSVLAAAPRAGPDLNEQEVMELICETCDRWFQLKPRYQGYDGMYMMLLVFADKVRLPAARAPGREPT